MLTCLLSVTMAKQPSATSKQTNKLQREHIGKYPRKTCTKEWNCMKINPHHAYKKTLETVSSNGKATISSIKADRQTSKRIHWKVHRKTCTKERNYMKINPHHAYKKTLEKQTLIACVTRHRGYLWADEIVI